ncbi:MAG: aspartate kinase [Alphaproteobacteria bacterium]|nr:aspartate kinase [Alphaproteobacteria bacterium]
MDCIVQKYGGTSIATTDLIKKVALRVKTEVESGYAVVVVVSAMAGTTNSLIGHVRNLSTTYDRAEYDVVLASGEQITAGLLAVALQNMNVSARSWLGWQIPIYTSSHHTCAKIEHINIENLTQDLQKGRVAIVAGFQGLSSDGRITTLGRGGSDTTAVALAAALNAKRCDIFTDVEGVYTADPRYVTSAEKLDYIAYQEMLELATQGANVLQKDSVELAMKHRVPLRVLSSLSEAPGTLIIAENELKNSVKKIRGLAHTLNEVKLTICALPQNNAQVENIIAFLESHQITIDMVHQNLSKCGKYLNLSFTILASEKERTIVTLQKTKNIFNFHDLLSDSEVAKISVIGPGLQTEYSPSHELFRTLREEEIEVHAVNASDIKLSVLITAHAAERAIARLHTVYQLDIEGPK